MTRIQTAKELRTLIGRLVLVTGDRIGFAKETLNFHQETRRREKWHYPRRTECLKPGYYVTTETREIKINKRDINYISENWIRI